MPTVVVDTVGVVDSIVIVVVVVSVGNAVEVDDSEEEEGDSEEVVNTGVEVVASFSEHGVKLLSSHVNSDGQ